MGEFHIPMDRPDVYFVDGDDTMFILSRDAGPLTMTKRQKAVAVALLDMALERVAHAKGQ